jgi:two-component system NtrC family sensor kinase
VNRREATEQALRQAQKMEAIGRLSGGIAHDFNNMLTVILGNIDMAARRIGDDNPRIQRLLDSAHQASERAATLVQRLLTFSRQHPQEVKSVDINRLVQSMSELLRRTIGETITVESVLAGGLWKVAVDVNQLENAIINLAVNARDAMPNGGRLTVETSNSYLDDAYVGDNTEGLSAGQYVMLAVTDSGTGMSRTVIERAFEPFFTTKPTGMGTGLGLSMVYGFVKQSNGHIKIDSEEGHGTTVRIYLPQASGAAASAGLPRSTDPEGGRKAILVVEDDNLVRTFVVGQIKSLGYHTLTAVDAAEALAVIDSPDGIDLLFTDMIMPGPMNGRQLADAALQRRPSLKVLFTSGYSNEVIIHHGHLDAGVLLLSKPYRKSDLARMIRAALAA